MLEFALSTLTTLLVILEPVGLVPVFLSVTSGMTVAARTRTALLASTLAGVILAGFALFGAVLLTQLGISLAAFRIAGGLLLFYTAFEMVFEKRAERRRAAGGGDLGGRGTGEFLARTGDDDVRRIAAVPLAVPLLAGPGAITAVILLAGKAPDGIAGQAVLIGMIAICCGICFAFFWAAQSVERLLGETGKIVLTRLFGVLLAALAVQFVADGVQAIVRPV